mmetsp:Transcript_6102/g.22342  ORF Transcript_6102/g.22342 Transcript_6102/m.22342 type:complete len:357 (+) Transcript_6102:526-1596(+)|eukprot:29420-Pelagococcus_subviridis.AAC.4
MHGREPGRAVRAEIHPGEERLYAAEARAIVRELPGGRGLERARLAREQTAERLRQRRRYVRLAVRVVPEHDQRAGLVPRDLRVRELGRRDAVDALLQEVLVQERQQHDALPVVALPLEVHLELSREKRRQRRVRRRHQPPERLRQQRRARRRLHREELLERPERDPVVEARGELTEPGAEVGSHRSVMERIVPRPRRDAAVVVPQHPVQALEVRLSQLLQRRGLAHLELELLAVVNLLPPLDPALLERVSLRDGHHRRLRADAAAVLGLGLERRPSAGSRSRSLAVLHQRCHRSRELIFLVDLGLHRGVRLLRYAAGSIPAVSAASAVLLGFLLLREFDVFGARLEHVLLHLAHHA